MDYESSDYESQYQKLLARWPVPVETFVVPTGFGKVRVNTAGTGPALVLCNGGLTTSAVWFNNISALARSHRVFAIDRGDSQRPEAFDFGSLDGIMTWLDAVCDGLGLTTAAFAGHSIGGWMSLQYALTRRSRVDRLILLDPSVCFAPAALAYKLHAIPMFARPSHASARRFFGWETRGRHVDEDSFDLMIEGAIAKNARIVMPAIPADSAFAGFTTPTLLVLAGRGRTQDRDKVERNARRLVADLSVVTLPNATHHTIPTEDADDLNAVMTSFLNRGL
jgi:pimeloyl-ACP methyl ester carboxylesterase